MDLNCRVCLQVGSIMVSVFEQVDKYEMSLCSLLQMLGGLDIDRNDDFPKYLCKNCTQQLLSAAEFRRKCKNSQELLIKMKYKENNKVDMKKTRKIITEDGILEELLPVTDVSEEQNFENEQVAETNTDNVTVENNKSDSRDLSEEIEKLENELLGIVPLQHKYTNFDDSFQQPPKLQPNIENEYSTLTFCCNKCKYFFPTVKLLKEHTCYNARNSKIVVEQNVKRFNCMFCNKKLQSEFALKMHQRTHVGERPFQCHICGNKFKSRPALVSHQNRHKSKAADVFCNVCRSTCSTCKKTFSSFSALKAHMQTHNAGGRLFQCSICSCLFAQPYDLDKHLKVHTGQKNVHCKHV